MKLATMLEDNVIESIVDGKGFRLVMFTQGCAHCCKGCHNPSTWDFNSGYEYNVAEIAEHILLKYRKAKDFYSGITISGGDPLFQKEELLELLILLKSNEPDMNVWIYTGFETDEFFDKFSYIAKYTDVVVTGKFIEEQRDLSCKFKGSRNQEVIEVKNYVVNKAI